MDQKINILAHLRENATGEIRFYRDYLWLYAWDKEQKPNTYEWEHGRYAFDDDRAFLFYGQEQDDIPSLSRGLFSVNLYNEEGKCLYMEFEEARVETG